MTLTPYAFWRRQHARHHGSWNNLDRRAASGLDIYSSCMTVAEYRALGCWRRCLVRFVSHPIVANLLLPPLVFVVLYRVPFDAAKGWRRERRGVYLTNLALAVLFGGLGLALGYGRVAAVQLPIMVIASIVGVWLFSIQHRFEHAQWMPDASWSFAAACLGGASYLRLPRFLQWFTGNIGFHHVHHVDPRIPNYRLEECHNADAGFQSASTLTLRTALQALGYVLWDSDPGAGAVSPRYGLERAHCPSCRAIDQRNLLAAACRPSISTCGQTESTSSKAPMALAPTATVPVVWTASGEE